jgi:hypothetical protein
MIFCHLEFSRHFEFLRLATLENVDISSLKSKTNGIDFYNSSQWTIRIFHKIVFDHQHQFYLNFLSVLIKMRNFQAFVQRSQEKIIIDQIKMMIDCNLPSLWRISPFAKVTGVFCSILRWW